MGFARKKWRRGQTPRAPPELALSARDWSELPLAALSLVFAKLGAVELLMGAGLVCRSWLDAAKAPFLWRSVDMANHKLVEEMDGDVLCAMANVAIDRSCGQLELFLGKHFVTDELLKYIGDRVGVGTEIMLYIIDRKNRDVVHRSTCLKGLGLTSCCGVSNEGFTELVTKSPLLEKLLLAFCPNVVGRDVYEATGKACTQLKHFNLHKRKGVYCWLSSNSVQTVPVGEGLGIATMHELQSLRLLNSGVTNEELAAVIDSCPHLEVLCLRGCDNIFVDDALRAQCAGIKELTLPSVEIDSEEEFVAIDCSRDFDYGSD
ncbi:hypothetical protein ACP70R_003479 [Stipagrostis hirtigluma subsp. patula]